MRPAVAGGHRAAVGVEEAVTSGLDVSTGSCFPAQPTWSSRSVKARYNHAMSGMRTESHVWHWAVALLIWLPTLYVLSSGPAKTFAWQKRTYSNSPLQPLPYSRLDTGTWWPRVYAPLVWASQQSWGGPVDRYLQVFPVREGRQLR